MHVMHAYFADYANHTLVFEYRNLEGNPERSGVIRKVRIGDIFIWINYEQYENQFNWNAKTTYIRFDVIIYKLESLPSQIEHVFRFWTRQHKNWIRVFNGKLTEDLRP